MSPVPSPAASGSPPPAGPGTAPGVPVLTRIERAGGASVAHIVLNRPQAGQARVIVIRGAGRHFCAGGDFHEVSRLRAEGSAALRRLFEAFLAACELIGELPVPVIAAVEGYAMAGGFELMQACDIAITRDDAVLADNHLNLGMIPGGGGSQRLPRIAGPQRALGLILSGDRLSGVQADQWGIVHRSVPAADFERAVADLAANMAGKDSAALARAKRLVREGLRLPLRDGLALETETIIDHLSGDEAGAGISRFIDRGTTGESS